MKLAAIQLDTAPTDVTTNVRKAMSWTRHAFEAGAQMVFLHEGLTADYSPDPIKYGRAVDSAEIFGFIRLANQYQGCVALGLNEVYQGQAYISCVYIDPDGIVDTYRKSYLWSLGDRDSRVPYKDGYRQELGIIGRGDGTRNIKVGNLVIGSIICADGNTKAAWDTFRADPPDIVFFQNNRGAVDEVRNQDFAREIERPMVATNRVGFSYHHFQGGGTRFIRRDGSIAAAANIDGREQIIYADTADL
jgi:predicted amidohydrolase